MDCWLIAVGWTDPSMWIAALEVAIGLGFVVFVHELGHFAVAKACGVKVEKFFIGFDIAGVKLCSFRWGETLYGIGILPLGGYVKMLGQEDNPAQLRKEMERARLEAAAKPAGAAAAASGEGNPGDVAAEAPAEGNPPHFDPRSYLAKSVPQRMAIISAGVIMNLIFAVVFAVVAFCFGVKQIPTTVGTVMAGGAAWQAGLQADDEVLEVAGQPVQTFRHMTEDIVTADLSHGVPLLVKRPGVEQPLEIVVKPEELAGAPRIGVSNVSDLSLMNEKNILPCLPASAAAEAQGPLMPGDLIEQIDGHAIKNYGQLQDFLVLHAGEGLHVTVGRLKDAGKTDKKDPEREKVQVVVPTNPMRHFGLVMTMGTIASLQAHSPAAEAGIKPGDLLKSIDGKPVSDPMRLPDEMHKRAGQEVAIGLERGGKPLALKAKLAAQPQYVPAEMPDSPLAISELGVAYYVLNTVARVEPGSPAAEAGLQAGDRITKARAIPPQVEIDELIDKLRKDRNLAAAEWDRLRKLAAQMAALHEKYSADELGQNEITFEFKENERNWPFLLTNLQLGLPGTTVEFTWRRGDKEMTAKATPVAAKDWFNSQRGWLLQPTLFVQTAKDFSQACRWGAKETADATLLVYRTLHSVGTSQISIRNFSGPWGIVKMALMQAREGFGNLLVFLTLLSANLAVINFLPIPLLDGGHLAMLIYEGVRGKPADERVQEVLTWIGLIFILTLTIFVFGLDLGWIPRPGAH